MQESAFCLFVCSLSCVCVSSDRPDASKQACMHAGLSMQTHRQTHKCSSNFPDEDTSRRRQEQGSSESRDQIDFLLLCPVFPVCLSLIIMMTVIMIVMMVSTQVIVDDNISSQLIMIARRPKRQAGSRLPLMPCAALTPSPSSPFLCPSA